MPLALLAVILAGVSLPAQAQNADPEGADAPVAADPIPVDEVVSTPPVAAVPVPIAGDGEMTKNPPEPAQEIGDGDDEGDADPVTGPPGEADPVEGVPPGKPDDVEEAPDDMTGGHGKAPEGIGIPAKSKGKAGAGDQPPAEEPEPTPALAPATPPAQPAAAPPADPVPGAGATQPGSSGPRLLAQRDTGAGQDGSGAGGSAGSDAGAGETPTPASGGAPTPGGASAGAPAGDEGGASGQESNDKPAASRDEGSPVTRTVREIVEVVPEQLKAALAMLAALTVLFGGGYLFAAMRARRLSRQRRELLQEVGLLQAALLPPVPANLGAVRASVAYRPADGPGAGGDFYDALTLPGGRAAFILGDVSGHGRAALAHTAFMRYTLRAYLEAGLEPRLALQVAERAVGGQLDGDFATVIVAVHDPANGSLTYASAGHPAPIVAGGARHEPVLAGWSPPIGWGLPTGLRQTTVPLPSGAIACFYTDGLAEATTADGILGRARLAEIVSDCGRDATAQDLLDRVSAEAVTVRDDMAACLIAPARHVSSGAFRTELLELGPSELHEGLAVRFLEECHVAPAAIEAARQEAHYVVDEHGGALMVVNFGVGGSRVQVLPRNVESLQAAAAVRRSAARS